MYFLYGGCHGHPPALLCSRCRRQYCSPANAWGIARPPVRRSKPKKPTARTAPATATTAAAPPRTGSGIFGNTTGRGGRSQPGPASTGTGTGQRGNSVKVAQNNNSNSYSNKYTTSKCPVRTGSSQQLISDQQVGQATDGSRKEPAKSSGKSFAEKLRSLLSCVS